MNNLLEKCMRVGVFGTFLGHGIVAFGGNTKWIPLITCYGFSRDEAIAIMPYIGIADIIIAFIILVYPIRVVVAWAILWAFMTALSRPISGDEFVEFVERSANWCLPLVLFLTLGIPKNYIGWLKVRE